MSFVRFMYHLPEIFYGAKVTMIDCISRISFEPYAKEIIESNSISSYYNHIFRKNKFIRNLFVKNDLLCISLHKTSFIPGRTQTTDRGGVARASV
jgi:hypothetical protein